MNSRLEQFIRDHREEFDADEPGKKVWEKIQLQVEPGKKKTAPVIRLTTRWVRWSAAAAVILVIAGGGWYYANTHSRKDPGSLASQQRPGAATTTPGTTTPAATTPDTAAAKSPELIAQTDSSHTTITKDGGQLAEGNSKPNKVPGEALTEEQSTMNEEMYHYARIVELKHKELKSIEKDEPLLYRQFSSDVYKLDSVYHNLETQLPKNPNREQLLEAMLQNLQLQMGLLNHQLDIIKQINHSKKTAYEKAYKTT